MRVQLLLQRALDVAHVALEAGGDGLQLGVRARAQRAIRDRHAHARHGSIVLRAGRDCRRPLGGAGATDAALGQAEAAQHLWGQADDALGGLKVEERGVRQLRPERQLETHRPVLRGVVLRCERLAKRAREGDLVRAPADALGLGGEVELGHEGLAGPHALVLLQQRVVLEPQLLCRLGRGRTLGGCGRLKLHALALGELAVTTLALEPRLVGLLALRRLLLEALLRLRQLKVHGGRRARAARRFGGAAEGRYRSRRTRPATPLRQPLRCRGGASRNRSRRLARATARRGGQCRPCSMRYEQGAVVHGRVAAWPGAMKQCA